MFFQPVYWQYPCSFGICMEFYMKEKIKGSLEKFSKSIVQPLMYLSVAGMILILGILLTNTGITSKLTFLQAAPFQLIGKLIYDCIMFIINNLSVIFCVGIAGALAKKDKGHASLIALMSYLLFLNANNITLNFFGKLAEMGALGLFGTGQSMVLGIQVLDTGVFGGIIMGCLTGYLFNKFGGKQFKGYFAMYSGVRFPFLLMLFISMFMGFGATFVWPVVQNGIEALTTLIKNSGNFGLYIYGVLNKLLVPTGLHHLVYTPFQFTDVGGTLAIGDTIAAGTYAIRVAEMNMPGVPFSDSTYFNSYTFNNLFPYIGIGFAFITTAFKENKEKTKAAVLPLMITAFLSAITEPMDFIFVFAAPVLFIVHSLLSGVSLVLLKIFHIPAGTSGGMINILISNIALGVEKTNWPLLLLMGVVVAAFYYVLFVALIKKFNFKTPGREIETETPDTGKPSGSARQSSFGSGDAIHIIRGLGGKENIDSLENCFTRLRVLVKDETLIDEKEINQVKNSGIKKKGKDIQIIFGMEVGAVRDQVENALETMK